MVGLGSLSVVIGCGGNRLSLLQLEEVSGLLITDTLTKEATPLPSSAAVQILTFLFFWSVFLCGPMGDKMKNRGMDRRHLGEEEYM